MARIRTIKPEFFTSDDICALSPRARLLYIGLWCEADREGRLVWAPRGFKRRYLPDDDCDVEALCRELTDRTLVRLYGDGLAVIPTFATHQHVNPRESASKLAPPPPGLHAPSRSGSPPAGPSRTSDASPSVTDAQGGKEPKEGKGREGEGRRASTAHALPEGWKPAEEDIAWARTARPDLTGTMVEQETERFRNFQAGQNRTAHNWSPLWRNWVMKAQSAEVLARHGPAPVAPQAREPLRLTGAHSVWTFRLMAHRPGEPWPEEHGAAPESDADNPKIDPDQRRQWRRHHGLPAAWQKVPT